MSANQFDPTAFKAAIDEDLPGLKAGFTELLSMLSDTHAILEVVSENIGTLDVTNPRQVEEAIFTLTHMAKVTQASKDAQAEVGKWLDALQVGFLGAIVALQNQQQVNQQQIAALNDIIPSTALVN